LQQERTQRLRAERMLSEVERECKVPFVVPALFQAFCRISELGAPQNNARQVRCTIKKFV
ncbi:hypothetical protein EDD22DRAFT_783447, partial [Suillus occidentalis]